MKKELLIGVSTIPGQFIIPGLLEEIIQKFPDVEIRLAISDSQKTFDKVVNGQIEVPLFRNFYIITNRKRPLSDVASQFISFLKSKKEHA